jgi:UDP-N-acetylglucosamine 1-carboxyvinyltransferase
VSKFVIAGGKKLEGSMKADGAKNAVLPILAAAILNGGKNIIHNCPELKDVCTTIEILEHLGCKVERIGSTITVDSSNIVEHNVPDNLMREMRSSVIFLGAIISRCGKAIIGYPGGCEIGRRPIDLHLKSLRQLGVNINDTGGYVNCSINKIIPGDIHLAYPSVGATENIMLAVVKGKGETVIRNAAKEPEINDLQEYLNAMGAKITGAGTGIIRINGVPKLNDVEHSIIPDRIAVSTYMIAAAATGGIVEIDNVSTEHIQFITSILKESGCKIWTKKNSIIVKGSPIVRPIELIRTLPYPGFPTDSQAPLMALCTIAEGTTIVAETVFENRYRHAEELIRMGANININGTVAVIKGVKKLYGTKVFAPDLRGGAALVIAGLIAEGVTKVENISYIDRGYAKIEEKLSNLGADIVRE